MAAQKKTGAKVMQTTLLSVVFAPAAMRESQEVRRTDLDQEAIEGERVVPQDQTAGITNDLTNAASDHAAHVAKRPPSNAKDDVDDHAKAEEGDEDAAGRHRRAILEHAPFDFAIVKRAVLVWAVGDQAVGQSAVWK
jgi:hypothetical protein